METFAEYLSFYINRAGISDAELARAIDVSRQTVFRWKEGLTGRPNNREDVLAIAKKLRLSSEETNILLQSAGFRPETAPVEELENEQQPVLGKEGNGTSTDSTTSNLLETDPSYLWRHLLKMPIKRKWLVIAVSCELTVLILIGVLANISFRSGSGEPDATDSAFNGESIIMISPFANSAGNPFSLKLSDAIGREISANRISGYHVAELSETITQQDEAELIIQNGSARMIVYGEYENNFVTVYFEPEIEVVSEDSIELNFSQDLPIETQSVALLALAHLSIQDNDFEQALSLLSQAHNNLNENVDNQQLNSAVSSMLDHVRDNI